MGIITLTTDLGNKDFYLASVKGTIYNQLPSIQIVDISHHIAPFNLAQGAFIFKNSFSYFPKKTVHIVGVNCDYTFKPTFLAIAYRDHYFVGPDNGIFSLVFDAEPEKVVIIHLKKEIKSPHFLLKEVLVDAACHLAGGGTLDNLGNSPLSWTKKVNLNPVMGSKFIRGTVIYIDDYQNVITNITLSHFQTLIGDKRFQIRFKRNESIDKISYHYGEVPEGEKLGLFGISGHLEIAINKGKASGLLGLRLDDIIQIDYED